MREQFEKLPEIAEKLRYGIYYSEENDKYYRSYGSSSDDLLYVRAAWYAFQEQQAIINDLKAQLNNMEACYIEKKKQVEAVEHVLGCAIIGPKEVFLYAGCIQEALRGEHD